MATIEKYLGKSVDGHVTYYFENAGPASYVVGGFSVTINALRAIDVIVTVGSDAGFRVDSEECTITLNALKIPVHYYGYACPGAPICSTGWEIPTGRSLDKATFSGIVIGH